MSLSKLLIGCLTALAGLVAAPSATAAADGARWAGLSDTLFKNHREPEALAVNAFAQDSSGFLWVGSQSGLGRWDGYRFRRYMADPQIPGSLPDSYVVALHVDTRGQLWIGTSAGGLARYDAQNDSFVVLGAGPGGLSGAGVSAIADDGDGGLWVGTGGGLDHLNAAGVVQRAPTDTTAALGLPEGGVISLLSDRSGTLWVGTRHGLLQRGRSQAAFSAVPLPTAKGSAPAVTQLHEDSAGRIWAGARSEGAFFIDAGQEVPEVGRVSGLQGDAVMAMVEATAGEMWLGTEGGGILVVDTRNGATRRIRSHARAPTGLSDDEVMAMFRDRGGLVWVATGTALSQHDPQQGAVVTLLGATGRGNGISHADVAFVLALPDGRIWLSVSGGGIDVIDPVRGRVGQLQPDAARPSSALPKGRVLAMVTGAGGEIYIGTQQGLYRSDSSGRRVERISVPERNPSAAVWALCFDAGVLWLGGLDGLWALDLHSAAKPALLRHEGAGALGEASVTAILRGRGDSLWVGTRVGLTQLDTVTGAIEQVPADSADPTRLPAGYLSSMLVDASGRLWVSTFGRGIQLLERRDADGRLRFRRFGLREGLPEASVDKLLEDAHGDIWASTDNGLAVIDTRTYAIRKLQRPEGLNILSYWTNAGAVTAAGELLFGGQGGLTIVRPERMTHTAHAAPVVVTDARIGAGSLPPGRFNQATGASAALEISPDDRGISIEFSALDYAAPERNRYAYRLLGFDADWIATESTRRMASYTNLPPGKYTLQLRGSSRDGDWSQPELEMPIRVLPAWYQTAWFRGLAGLCALGMVGALVQARTVYLRRRQRQLQGLVAERTAELMKRSDELHESQRRLELIAYADPLTGLPNRRHFNDDLRSRVALALRDGGPFTLLLIDLDGFKAINDAYGHDAGDALLVEIAVRLNRAVREADRVARTGGDEFAVLLTQTCEHEIVEAVCSRIIDSLAEPVWFNGVSMQVSASIGAALCPTQGAQPDALYKAADVALYDAKRGGRNAWRWYRQRGVAGQPDADPTPSSMERIATPQSGPALPRDVRSRVA